MNFKVGEKVVCVADAWTAVPRSKNKDSVPVKHEIVTIKEITFYDNVAYLSLCEHPLDCFEASFFRKLDYDFVEQVIAQVTQIPVVIK